MVLYRLLTQHAWSKLELTYNPATSHATGRVNGLTSEIEYLVQAVDGMGNVGVWFYTPPRTTVDYRLTAHTNGQGL